jgi:phytoene synthase
MTAAMDGAARLAMEQVRAGDHDRYVATLYAPQEKRASLFALYAFDVEISSIRSRVREPLAGELRLQWWRDAIASGNAQGHPLAQALLQAVEEHKLPRAALDACLEARIFDLYDDPMPSTQDLEGYCGETSAAMIQLAALVLDPAGAPAAAEAAGHGGCARAMAGLLCALPLHRARGQCFVPRDILVAAGTTPESFVKGEDSAATGRAIEALVAFSGGTAWACQNCCCRRFFPSA